jgi:5-(carboxyamino)imidazole ribonucleotide synthase
VSDSERNRPILPGSTIGVLGSGQLGRMLALSARRFGYRVHTFSPDRDTPCGQVADAEIVADYADLDAVKAFARGVDVVTFEFENVPAETAAAAADCGLVRPSGSILQTTQHRLREKHFLAQSGFPLPPFREVHSHDDLVRAINEIGCPAVLKTAGWGYDGKGQVRIDRPHQSEAAWQSIATAAKDSGAVLEGFVDFQQEVSVVVARGVTGERAVYPVFGNTHRHHILDVTICPAAVLPEVAQRAEEMALAVAEEFQLVGVLCVEFFVTGAGELLINEMAPRPHNSGHLTIDACPASQFEQQLRAVCGLPLGSTELIRPAAMANLLGDLWLPSAPNWPAALAEPGVHLHLYGKLDGRPGRKMGHLTALGASAREADAKVRHARELLEQR